MPTYTHELGAYAAAIPAPGATLEVSSLSDDAFLLRLPSILDTGAEISCVPAAVFDEIPSGLTKLVAIWGANGVQEQPACVVNVRLEERPAGRCTIVASSLPCAYVGRDILNQFKLTLDGPAETWRFE